MRALSDRMPIVKDWVEEVFAVDWILLYLLDTRGHSLFKHHAVVEFITLLHGDVLAH